MPFKIIEDDITNLDVDVIVNAANKELQQGGGVSGAIFNAAGAAELQAACDEIGECPVGEAVMTDGFQLPAKKIIHTVGPIWQGGHANEATQLKNCYQNALTLAHANDLQSIAFPLISSGIYGYPIEEAFRIAGSTIREFLQEHEMLVYLVIFDRKILRVNEHLITSISKYLDEHLEEEQVYLQS
ncbi:macro domain-containing protein [Sporosarcina ureilytica]|uniref:macro domain-containing protein n=1 Tax=Sporosarcina ureilytica TaxID=298596 RepID=UPI000A939C5D